MQTCLRTKQLAALTAGILFLATALAAGAAASAPISLTALVHGRTVYLSWTTSGSLPIRHYDVLEGTSPANLGEVAVTTQVSWEDRDLTPGTTYYFAVAGGGSVSNVVPVTIPRL